MVVEKLIAQFIDASPRLSHDQEVEKGQHVVNQRLGRCLMHATSEHKNILVELPLYKI